jgi:O-acetyl-ADP-ribose deacetylase (regulator of RNase III)
MIHEVAGDILLTKAQVIAHGVAANDPMSEGLALSLHERFPSMHKDFHHWCHVNRPAPGAAWLWGGAVGVRIVNLITQEGGYGHGARPEKATLKHVRDSLKELTKIIKKESITSVALPKLATGVGGLEWNDVYPVIKERLEELDTPVYLYTEFHVGQQAREPGLS